jgi:hypothetical protein
LAVGVCSDRLSPLLALIPRAVRVGALTASPCRGRQPGAPEPVGLAALACVGAVVKRLACDGSVRCRWAQRRRRLASPLLSCLAIQAGWFLVLIQLDRLMLPSAPPLLQPVTPSLPLRSAAASG